MAGACAPAICLTTRFLNVVLSPSPATDLVKCFALADGQQEEGLGNVLPVQPKMFLLQVPRENWVAFKSPSHCNDTGLTICEAGF